jgi:hypothetical protein
LSLPLKVKVADVLVVGSTGPLKIVVLGGIESDPGGAAITVQV